MRSDRVRLRLSSGAEALAFVAQMRMLEDSFAIENGNGRRVSNAKSLMGVLNMLPHQQDGLFLVNETHDGQMPAWIGCYISQNA